MPSDAKKQPFDTSKSSKTSLNKRVIQLGLLKSKNVLGSAARVQHQMAQLRALAQRDRS